MSDDVQRRSRPWSRPAVPPRPENGGRSGIDPVAVITFDGSAPLINLLVARGIRVKVFDSLPAALADPYALHTAVLVVRLLLEPNGAPVTFLVRGFGVVSDNGDERFHDRFAQMLPGPIDAQALCSAVIRHAHADRGRPGRVA